MEDNYAGDQIHHWDKFKLGIQLPTLREGWVSSGFLIDKNCKLGLSKSFLLLSIVSLTEIKKKQE